VNGTNSSQNCATAKPNCVPASLLDPTAATIMNKFVPLPNATGSKYNGFFTAPVNQDEYLGKYDEVISDKDHVAGSYFRLNTLQDAYGGGNIPYMITRSQSTQHVLNLSDIHTFNGTTANQAWITFTRVAGGRTNLPTISLGDLGSSFTIQGAKGLAATRGLRLLQCRWIACRSREHHQLLFAPRYGEHEQGQAQSGLWRRNIARERLPLRQPL
jgi:hypothetical protein